MLMLLTGVNVWNGTESVCMKVWNEVLKRSFHGNLSAQGETWRQREREKEIATRKEVLSRMYGVFSGG